jgi:hypothetical protein
LVKGIVELQSLGIYHQDLGMRNTRRIPQKGDKDNLVYQIVDFDQAFKVGLDRKDSLIEISREIIRLWLEFDGKEKQDNWILGSLFKEVEVVRPWKEELV